MPDVTVSKLERVFPDGHRAVDDVDLTIADGELFTLLGPSGCGKTTTLSCIAGLDKPTSGRISIGPEVIFDRDTGTNLPCEERNIGMVFQSYALWPQMTVAEQLDLPLRIRSLPKANRRQRIGEALEMVELGGLEHRYPHELSGGQQQRVALARALVYAPKLLLLDEPLSNLDARLRYQARGWIKRIQEELRITTIYVTHDQEEALAMSDTIAVMSRGRVIQCADPQTIYDSPANLDVASFMGRMNFLRAQVIGRNGPSPTVKLEGTGETLALGDARPDLLPGSAVTLAFRPEKVIIHDSDAAGDKSRCSLRVEIVEETYVGFRYEYRLRYGDARLEAYGDRRLGLGPRLATIDPSSIRVYETGPREPSSDRLAA